KSQTTDSLIPPRLKNRRNSRSLPASPQTSPKVFRKNPFFANIFFGSTELVNVAGNDSTLSRTESTEVMGDGSWSARVVRAFNDGDSPPPTRPAPRPATPVGVALKAKPSELREMNFWSPTSM
ncbi:unnamed protein product, partial [Nesidiocoris tenuis]